MRTFPFSFWQGATGGGGGPTVSAAETVTTAGGDVSIVTLDSTTGVSDVKVNAVSQPFFVLSATKVAVITQPLAAGTYDVSATNGSGTGTGTGVLTVHDMNDANATLLLEKGQYVGDTWIDQSATGSDFSDATYYAPEENKEPQFNDGVAAAPWQQLSSAATLGDLVTGTNYSFSFVVRARALEAPATPTVQDGPTVFCDGGGYTILLVSDSWVRWYHYDNTNGYSYVEASALSIGAWHVIDVVCDSGSLKMRIDGGAWSSPASVLAIGSMGAVCRIARSYTGTNRLQGDVRLVQASNVARGDAWFDANLAAIRSRFCLPTAAGEPEIDATDSDVFDPAGGDRMVVRGRNLDDVSLALVGNTQTKNVVEAVGSIPKFSGAGSEYIVTSSAASNYVTTGAGTISVLICPRSAAAASGAGSPYVNAAIVNTNGSGYVILGIAAEGIRCAVYDGAYKETALIPIRFGIWNQVDMRWNGSVLEARVNGGAWDSVATTGPSVLTATLHVGSNYNNAAVFDGLVGEVAIANTALSDGTLDSIRGGRAYEYKLDIPQTTPSAYDRAALSLAGLWKMGDFASGTWTGTASAGASGGRNLAPGTAPAAYSHAAKALGHIDNIPDCDGANDELSLSLAQSNFVSAAQWWTAYLFRVDNFTTNAAASLAYNNTQLACDKSANTAWGLSVAGSGESGRIDAWHYNATVYAASAPIARGRWYVAVAWYDGTNINLSLNGVLVATTAAPNIGAALTGTPLGVAKGYVGGTFFDGKIAEIALTSSAYGSSEALDFCAYVNSTYGLSLGGVAPRAFDPTTLSFGGYWKAGGYTSGTWSGVASAGSSSGRDLTEATNPPRVSSGENLIVNMPAKSASKTLGPMPRLIPYADGPQYLKPQVANNVAFGANGFAYAVVRIEELPAPIGYDYGDGTLLTDLTNAETTFGITTNGVCACVYDGAYKRVDRAWATDSVDPYDGQFHLLAMRFNGTNLEVSIDGGTWTQTACGSPSFLTTSPELTIGRSYGSKGIAGLALEWGVSNVAHSDTDLANIIKGINYEYGLNIGGLTPTAFDRASLSWTCYLRRYERPSNTVGTWKDNPSAGSSGARHAILGSGAPALAAVTLGGESLTLVNSSGQASLTDAIESFDVTTADFISFRGEDGITLVGSKVSAWANQSGLGNATQSTDANRPTYVSSDPKWGGRASLQWGTSDPMNLATIALTGQPFAQPITWYIGVRFDTTVPSAMYVFDQGDASATSRQALLMYTNWDLYAGLELTAGGSPIADVQHLFCGIMNGTSSAIRAGRYHSTLATGDTGNNALHSVTIGQRYNIGGGTQWAGSIPYLYAFNGAHSTTERRRVLKALGSYYQQQVTA